MFVRSQPDSFVLSPEQLASIGLSTQIDRFIGTSVSGLPLEPRTDTNLLREGFRDERPFEEMIGDDLISGILCQLNKGASSKGFAVHGGDPELLKWTESWLKSSSVDALINLLADDLLRRVPSSGWRPVEIPLELCFRFGGTSYYSPVTDAVRIYQASRSALTQRVQVAGETFSQQLAISGSSFTLRLLKETEKPRWHWFRYGSTAPYGAGLMSPILKPWLTKLFLDKQLRGAAGRTLGGLKAELIKQGNAGGDEGAASAALQEALRCFDKWGILYSPDFDFTTFDMQNTADYLQFVDHVFKAMVFSLLTQNLTTEVQEGSRAAAVVHQEMLSFITLGLAKWVSSALTAITHRVIQTNFPEAMDEEDLPVIRARVLDEPSIAAAQFLIDGGAPVDGRPFADFHRVTLLANPGEPVPLSRQQDPSPVIGTRRSGTRALSDAPDDPEQASPALQASLFAAEDDPAIKNLARNLDERWRSLNGGPTPVPLSQTRRAL